MIFIECNFYFRNSLDAFLPSHTRKCGNKPETLLRSSSQHTSFAITVHKLACYSTRIPWLYSDGTNWNMLSIVLELMKKILRAVSSGEFRNRSKFSLYVTKTWFKFVLGEKRQHFKIGAKISCCCQL